MTRISVIVTTYNHEGYLAEALDSVLGQRGDLSLEIIVADDASTDGTFAIARGYGERFPGIVRALPPPAQNLGLTRNFERCIHAATGDFVSVCEGDDYFSNPDKLALEVDFLRRREDCALCFSAVVLKDDATGAEALHPGQVPYMDGEHVFTTRDLVAGNFMGTFGTYRGEVVRGLPPALYDLAMADWLFNLACSRRGKIGFLNTRAYVNRIHPGNTVTGRSAEFQITTALKYIDSYDRFLDLEFHEDFVALERALSGQLAALGVPR